MKTPIPLDASLVGDKEPMLVKLTVTRGRTLSWLETVRDRNLGGYRFRHPLFGSLNLYDWLRVLAYHETRHAKQLREIVEIFQE